MDAAKCIEQVDAVHADEPSPTAVDTKDTDSMWYNWHNMFVGMSLCNFVLQFVPTCFASPELSSIICTTTDC